MVKRYELQEGESVEDTGLVEDDFGYWVEYPDYAALEARIAELEKDAARYRWLRDVASFGDWESASLESSSDLDEHIDIEMRSEA